MYNDESVTSVKHCLVCLCPDLHTVLYHITRFLQSAEMLKPSTPTTSQDEEIIEYFPHLLFLQNRATTTDFSPAQVKLMQVCSFH